MCLINFRGWGEVSGGGLPEYSINSKAQKCALKCCWFNTLKNHEKMEIRYYTWSIYVPGIVPETGVHCMYDIMKVMV